MLVLYGKNIETHHPTQIVRSPLLGCTLCPFSIFSKYTSLSGGHLRHPQPEDEPFCIDRDQNNMVQDLFQYNNQVPIYIGVIVFLTSDFRTTLRWICWWYEIRKHKCEVLSSSVMTFITICIWLEFISVRDRWTDGHTGIVIQQDCLCTEDFDGNASFWGRRYMY